MNNKNVARCTTCTIMQERFVHKVFFQHAAVVSMNPCTFINQWQSYKIVQIHIMQTTRLVTKPHYLILDGLRGVASVMVVAFHIFEAHSTSHLDQIINHGYLAVDFFFVLSGFVVAYAYDDRWGKMSVGGFFKLRLIRLQPMVVMGMIIGGALLFIFRILYCGQRYTQCRCGKCLLLC